MSATRTPRAEATGAYLGLVDGVLTDLVSPGTPPPRLARLVHDGLRALVDSDGFSCLGAKAAMHQGFYRLGVFGELGGDAATRQLAGALERFVDEREQWDADYSTMIASFTGPVGIDEATFERALWEQLSRLHEVDDTEWDGRVSDDPDDPHFSFSFAGQGFFVVGLHGATSRYARRFAWPTLVFNPHDQFERLRQSGGMERLQHMIREREVNLQGDLNPNLSDYGSAPEARQYSGRPVGDDWQCPFRR
jgi:FPC/CPF motif-containing protein YcgG